MLFRLTPAEQTRITRYAEALDRKKQAARALDSVRYGDGDERAAALKEFEDVKKEIAVFDEDPIFLTALLKQELEKKLTSSIPGGSLDPLLEIALQLIDFPDTPDGKKVAHVLRSAALRLIGIAADPDLNRARAMVTKARIDALLEAGLPQNLVHDIIVAEAAKPWPDFKTSK